VQGFTILVNPLPEIRLDDPWVPENSPGAPVGNLSLSGVGAGTAIQYQVDDPRFQVDDGVLRLLDDVALDYEQEPLIPLRITATDPTGNSFQQLFQVQVEDRNDAPTALAVDHLQVLENHAGAAIGRVSVVDQDVGDRHGFTVAEVGEDGAVASTRFEVVNGVLRLAEGVALDHEAEPDVELLLTATDAAGAAISSRVTVLVGDVNEAPTRIEPAQAEVPEALPGAVVGALQVIDPDLGDSHSLLVDDPRFLVQDGVLRLQDGVALDFEREPQVELTITATDRGGLSLTHTLLLNVLDRNETLPEVPGEEPPLQPLEPPPLPIDGLPSGWQSLPLITATVRGEDGAVDRFYGSLPVLMATVRGEAGVLEQFYGSERRIQFAEGPPLRAFLDHPAELGPPPAAEPPPPRPAVEGLPAGGLTTQMERAGGDVAAEQELILQLLRDASKLIGCGAK
jgi:hypothetical protein